MKVGRTIWVLDELRGVEVETELEQEAEVAGAITYRLQTDCHRVERDSHHAPWRRVSQWTDPPPESPWSRLAEVP